MVQAIPLAIHGPLRENAVYASNENKTMILYRYLTGPDDSAFCHKVTAALNKGWLLQGHPTLTFDAAQGRTICGQAIIKEVDGEEYDPAMKLSDY